MQATKGMWSEILNNSIAPDVKLNVGIAPGVMKV